MIIPATAKRIWAITRGCADWSANFVAVAADAQKRAKSIPADIHFKFRIYWVLSSYALYKFVNIKLYEIHRL